MTGTSPNAILEIIKGIAKVTGDTNSAEQGLDPMNLLDPLGFSCDSYDIQLPNMKSSAIYADSPITDGRTFISGALGNVTETIRLQLNAGTLVQMAAMLSKLAQFRQDCNDFWDTFGQIEPVYLKHQIEGEPGPRYALLYNIEIHVETPNDPGDPHRLITLSIEREYGWRGIAPGDNPKRWAFDNVFSNQKMTTSNASLLSGNDFLVYDTSVLNRAEQNAAQTSYNTRNFVDIPANKIPGDLPALLCFEYGTSGTINAATAVFISKTSKRNTSNINRSTGVNEYIVRIFNAADATVVTDTSLAADTGASTGTTGLQRRSQTTFGTATLARRLTFQGRNLAVMRGRYMVFTRARLSASSTTVQLQLALDEVGSSTQLIGNPVNFSDEGTPSGTGNTTLWGLVYLGVITLPSNNRRTAVSPNGLGQNIGASSSGDVGLGIYAARSAGAGVLYINDLILMPIDEGAVRLISTGSQIGGGANPSNGVVYDNTGYMTHGFPDDYATVAQQNLTSNWSELDRLEIRGQSLYLSPNVDNRLEFLAYTDSTLRSSISNPPAMTIRLSIVPRWSGFRTV